MAVWFRHLGHGQYVYFKILAFTGPLTCRGASGGFPSGDGAVAQDAVRRLRPADVEQFFEINGVLLCRPQEPLAIVRMNCHLVACEKTGSDPGPGRAQCQSRGKSTPIGNATGRYHWN